MFSLWKCIIYSYVPYIAYFYVPHLCKNVLNEIINMQTTSNTSCQINVGGVKKKCAI